MPLSCWQLGVEPDAIDTIPLPAADDMFCGKEFGAIRGADQSPMRMF